MVQAVGVFLDGSDVFPGATLVIMENDPSIMVSGK